MLSIRRFVIAFWLLTASFTNATAQEAKTLNHLPSTEIVTAFVSTDGVRFAAFGAATEMRLEVYASIGERVFDSGFRKGALLDWSPAQGSSSLPDGAYLCVVTYRDLQSRLRQKLGGLAVEAGRATLQEVSRQPLTPEQSATLAASRKAQSIEAAEDDEALTILPESAERAGRFFESGIVAPSATGTGTLNFIAKWKETGGAGLLGDSGLFEETDGDVGVGTASPQSKLHVTGKVIGEGTGSGNNAFADFGRLNTAGSGEIGFQLGRSGVTDGVAVIQGAKEGVGPNNIAMQPSGGNVGIGTTSPGHPLDVTGNINTSTSYYIRNVRVLSAPGENNLYAGQNAFLRGGENNTIIGAFAGQLNFNGSQNTLIGALTISDNLLTNATAIGYRAQVSQRNSLVLGGINGVNGATADTNVGIGTNAPTHRLTIGVPETPGSLTPLVGVYGRSLVSIIVRDTLNDVEGKLGVNAGGMFVGSDSNHDLQLRTENITRVTIGRNGGVVIGEVDRTSDRLVVNGDIITQIPDNFPESNERHLCAGIGFSPGAGPPTFRIVRCLESSSIRFKKDIRGLTLGLDLVSRLRPVNFRWKDNGREDVGLIAEEVERVEPLFVKRNDKDEVEGVRYDRLGVVLIKAVQEQQAQIKEQQQQLQAKDARITDLETRLASLERLVNERINRQPSRTKVSWARRPTTARR